MRRAACLVLLIATIGACNREAPVTQSPPDNRAKMNPVVPASPHGVEAAAQLPVELSEYEIRVADTLPAGHHSFMVVNSGKQSHSLVIEGNGTHAALPQQLTRGDSAPLAVDLKPGTYTFYCPVDG